MTAGAEPQDGPAEDPPLPGGSGESVLVVEDDSALRRMAGIQLRSLGYRVLEAEDGRAALQLLRSECEIDLLLTDVVMPGGLSGAELGRKARELRPDLRLMYMSGFPRAVPGDRSALERNVVLLRKPFRRKEMAMSVRKALEG